MPSVLTHPAVAIALAPWFRRLRLGGAAVAAGAVCTIIPDLDVIGLGFGVPYESIFGHRGLSHSLAFAGILALALAGTLARVSPPGSAVARFCFLFLCAASHGFLDAFTDGGLGVAFFAPFDGRRYFFPWRPIEVSPLGISRFLSARGGVVLLSELRWVIAPCAVAWILGVVRRSR